MPIDDAAEQAAREIAGLAMGLFGEETRQETRQEIAAIIRRYGDARVAEEREACAAMVDAFAKLPAAPPATTIAAAIRARGK